MDRLKCAFLCFLSLFSGPLFFYPSAVLDPLTQATEDLQVFGGICSASGTRRTLLS
jgi:hypothetical protein